MSWFGERKTAYQKGLEEEWKRLQTEGQDLKNENEVAKYRVGGDTFPDFVNRLGEAAKIDEQVDGVEAAIKAAKRMLKPDDEYEFVGYDENGVAQYKKRRRGWF